MEAFRSQWDIPTDFLIVHATNRPGQKLWDEVMNTHRYESASTTIGYAHEQCHIEGVLPHLEDPGQSMHPSRFPRRSRWDASCGWQSSTKISYRRVTNLSLTDRGMLMQKDTDRLEATQLTASRLSLRVPYSLRRGGLSVPQLYESGDFALFVAAQSFISYDWQWYALFYEPEHAVTPAVFLHFVSASALRTNLRFLNRKTERIAIRDIRRPDQHINDI
ncbi:hypothetical protein DOTSEDRAFT_35748 [Dothistroma septosporum NZE10]|uniref:Uncharacterized protein n=1 Tax=Dothistroma septosporum (strain NZE10 / CBS 128990) TaxID=675120 RepID=M2XM25_DOTSN|nr:hypothetical protein DOTSEDRAFT_35748 [Dothistroma septosporum NZE10]